MSVSSGNGGQVDLWATNAFQVVLKPLAERLRNSAGADVAIRYRSSNMIMAHAEKGERGDAVIGTRPAMEELARRGIVEGGSITSLASTGLGLGVRAGRAKPDVSSDDAVRRTLLAARNIAYSSTGASATYFLQMVERLGIAEAVKAKAIVYEGGLVGELVASGEADVCAQMVSEIVAVPGVELAGDLPAQFRNPTVFAGALFVGSQRGDAARAIIAMLARPDARPLFEAAGMAPAA